MAKDPTKKAGYQFWEDLKIAPGVKQYLEFSNKANQGRELMRQRALSGKDGAALFGVQMGIDAAKKMLGSPYQHVINPALDTVSDVTNIDRRSINAGLMALPLARAAARTPAARGQAFMAGQNLRSNINQMGRDLNFAKNLGKHIIKKGKERFGPASERVIRINAIYDDVWNKHTNTSNAIGRSFKPKTLPGTNPANNIPRSVGAAGKETFTNEGFIAPFDPKRLARIKSVKTSLIEKTADEDEQLKKDSLNPNLDLKTRVDLSGKVQRTGYRRDGTFDYKLFKKESKNMDDQGRSWLGIYQSRSTSGGASAAVPFEQYKNTHKPKLIEEYGPTLQAMGLTNENSLQIHHIAALKSIMGIFDGLQMDSRLYRQVSKAILDELPGLGLGDMLGNLKPVVGGTNDVGTPHYLVHRFYNSKLGKKGSGESFFTDKMLKNMEMSRSFRLKKAKEIAQVIKKSEEIVTQAQKVYRTLFSASTQNPVTLDEVVEVMSEMNDKGFVDFLDEDFQVDKVPQIVESIINDIEINGFPTERGPAWWQEGRKIKKRYVKKRPPKPL